MDRRSGLGGRIEDLVAAQLGRRPRALRGVAVWCPFGFPAVIESSPYLEDGTPFPTLFYLTCPNAVLAIGRREGEGGVRMLRVHLRHDPVRLEALRRLEALYRQRRRELAGEGPWVDQGAALDAGIGGVAGVEESSCLHALAAALLAAVSHYPGLITAPPPPAAVVGEWRDLLDSLGPLWCRAADCRAFVSADPASGAGPAGNREGDPQQPWTVRRAAVDVGTMSTRLLVADVVDGRPHDVLRETTITRLGESLGLSGRLQPAARARTTQAVSRFVAAARAHGAGSIILMGTSAVRDALDGREYLDQLEHSLGTPTVVASGEMEARLAYAGATLDVPDDPILLDIGGGSTELVRRDPAGHLFSVSLQLGSVRSTERWLRHDPPLPSELAHLRREAEELLEPVAERVLRRERSPACAGSSTAPRGPLPPLVGVAGTITTLACLHLGLASYDRGRIHLASITRASLDRHLPALAGVPAAGRLLLGCMQPGREEVIVAGAVILQAAMAVLGYGEIVVSERDLLDGMILHAEELERLAAG